MFKNLFGPKKKSTGTSERVPADVSVASARYDGEQIRAAGFHFTGAYSHMLPWLGRGEEPAQYVTRDVEAEVTRQQPGSHLSSIECTGEPDAVTKGLQEPASSIAQVTAFEASFPLLLIVEAADGAKWRLRVKQTYVATGLEEGGERRLRQDFTVEEAARLS
jgi:hypothetical protein